MNCKTTYYFDSVGGSDGNDGLSVDSPKRSLAAINQLIARDDYNSDSVRIRIKAGSEYTGTLKVCRVPNAENAYTDAKPLVIDVYGVTENNQYAKINAPYDGVGVEVDGSNIRISGLEVTGEDAEKGFHLNTSKPGAMKNVVISGNYCHDISFDTRKLTTELDPMNPPDEETVQQICPDGRYNYSRGAIIADANSESGASWFEDLWIENNRIERVSKVGIWVFSNWVYRPGVSWGLNRYVDDNTNYYPHKNVIIRGNELLQTGGDGIVTGAIWGGWVENNTAYYSQYLGRTGYYSAAIWSHSCKDMVFQYNEAAYTYQRNGAGDGQGFDLDLGNTNITFRYNYSHHNEGGGILFINNGTDTTFYNPNGTVKEVKFCAPTWSNVTVRNNVFADNGGAVFDARGQWHGKIQNLTVENNTVVVPGTSDNEYILDTRRYERGNIVGNDDNWVFRNNIFVSKGDKGAKFNTGGFDLTGKPDNSIGVMGAEFYSNVFWGFPSGFESTILTKTTNNVIDRIYVKNPGIDRTQNAKKGLDSMRMYKPRSGDVLTGADALTERELYDAAGVKVRDRLYFGAFSTL